MSTKLIARNADKLFSLRPYQEVVVNKINDAWTRVRAVLLVLATGGGKTVIFSYIMQQHSGASAAVVHRKEIVAQISLSLARLGVKHRIIAPPPVVALIRRKHLKILGRSFVDPHAMCGVISVQTLTSKSSSNNRELQKWLEQVTLCVFDEGHHYVSTGLWARAVELMANAVLLFVTATPERADGKGLGAHASGFCQEMILGPDTQWLTERKFLSRFIYKAPESDLDVSGVAITASGDLNTKALRARVVDSSLIGDVVDHYNQHAAGTKAIVFSTDVLTANEQATAFCAAGWRAVALSGETDQGTRDRALADFEAGDIDIVVNVDLFDEGFDVPAVITVILGRPTESLAKFLQMIGRGLRILEGKDHAIVIDPVRNWERHGMPNWPRSWSMDDRSDWTGGSSPGMVLQIVCLGCTQPYEAYYCACPGCGLVPVPLERSKPKFVQGDLLELDVEGMLQLFNEMAAADMNDDEYALGQLERNIPPIGRPADLKRHQAAKYRRKVLRELVAWWVGMQPVDRSMSEKHRRFYHRFGTDIGTAFTLDAKGTDALIDTIRERFAYDIQ